jgi:LmbE family N-acetylglucosaminyl deacetylase
MRKAVLGIFAHPDDAEFSCAGTLALLSKSGWEIHIATMTPGDKGSAVLNREAISEIRKAEALVSARILGGSYHCLGLEDIFIFYERETINNTTSLIRKIRPSLVFTASPDDYMVDHEITSKIVQTACFCAGIKNMEIAGKPFEPVPYLYYSDPLEAKNILGYTVYPSVYVDITTVIETKKEMLGCHKSQREWLLVHHKIDEYILSMIRFAKNRGMEINTSYAEGFRQHLGHGYPSDNVLKELLGNFVTERDKK